MKILRFIFLISVFMCGAKLLAQNDSDNTETYHQQAHASSYSMDVNFVNQISSGNMMEVKLSKLAEQKSTSEDIKKFARRLESDHSKTIKQLEDIAVKNNISVNSGMPPEYTKRVDDLNTQIGASFDKEYIKIMINDHKNDIKKFEDASLKVNNANLKSWINKTLPELKNHLKSALEIQKELDRM